MKVVIGQSTNISAIHILGLDRLELPKKASFEGILSIQQGKNSIGIKISRETTAVSTGELRKEQRIRSSHTLRVIRRIVEVTLTENNELHYILPTVADVESTETMASISFTGVPSNE